MREVLSDLLGWWESGRTVGMATVVRTWRSSPRPAGATMLVGPDGTAVGSVSGGCVEGAVYELSGEVVESGSPLVQRYGVSDDDAFAVGLTCGGIIELLIEPVSRETFPELAEVAAAITTRDPVAVVSVVEGPPEQIGKRMVVWPTHASGSLGSERLDAAAGDDARGCSPPGGPTLCTTAWTASGAARGSPCSSPRTPRRPG
ncbi:XdhC family protein [Dactylosporangium cerinum]